MLNHCTLPAPSMAIPQSSCCRAHVFFCVSVSCRRKAALLWEVRLLEKNANAFNEEDSDIVRSSKALVALLCKFIKYVMMTSVCVHISFSTTISVFQIISPM